MAAYLKPISLRQTRRGSINGFDDAGPATEKGIVGDRYGDGEMATITGTVNADELEGTSADDMIDGLGGDDTLYGQEGDDRLIGGEGRDTLFGMEGDDTLDGGEGDDNIAGGPGADVVLGGAGDDFLIGPDAGEQDVLIDGGEGTDRLFINRLNTREAVSVALDDGGSQQFDGTPIINVEQITFFGGSGDDLIVGGALSDVLQGSAGDDRLEGNAGDDHLDGGEGTDIVSGGAGNDTLTAGAGDLLVDGGDGTDYASFSYQGETADLTFTFADGASQLFRGTTIVNVERIEFIGGEGADVITGGASADRLVGFVGDDKLYGGGGDDTLIGVQGSDALYGGDGDDSLLSYLYGGSRDTILDGGTGVDFADVVVSDSVVDLRLSLADGSVQQLEGMMLVSVERIHLATGSGDDDITGGMLADRLFGSAGSDRLHGGAGDDELLGGEGDDRLVGGDGNDLLRGDAGDDVLDGQGGVDLVFYDFLEGTGRDRIVNFSREDLLVTMVALKDANNDGIIDFGRNRVLDIESGSSAAITDSDGLMVRRLEYDGVLDQGNMRYYVYSSVDSSVGVTEAAERIAAHS